MNVKLLINLANVKKILYFHVQFKKNIQLQEYKVKQGK